MAFWFILAIVQGVNQSLVRYQKRWRLRLIQWLQKSQLNRVRSLTHQVEVLREILIKWSPKPVNFANTLVDEGIKVMLVLAALFWLANNQGLADARRDAFDRTSTLPVVTFIFPENVLALGRQFDPPEALVDKQPANQFRMLGDPGLLEALRGVPELNDVKKGRVWRLLIERDGWIYLFRTLEPCSENQLVCDANLDQRPLLLMVRESDLGNQLLILSPSTSE